MRVPVMQALPWQMFGSVLIRVRQSMRALCGKYAAGQAARPDPFQRPAVVGRVPEDCGRTPPAFAGEAVRLRGAGGAGVCRRACRVSRYGRWSPRSIQLATNVPVGKIEVMEVFSYGCIACNGFQPVMERLTRSLPPNAQIVLVPASFNPGEAWPIFQRAYFAAWTPGDCGSHASGDVRCHLEKPASSPSATLRPTALRPRSRRSKTLRAAMRALPG